MTEDQLEHLRQNQERLALVMLRHCMILAARRYRWSESHPLPEGTDPEIIVEEVIQAYLAGDRNFDAKYPIEAQLKKGIESRLWALHQRKGAKAASVEAMTDAVGDFIAADDPTPDFDVANNHDAKLLFGLLLEAPEVQKSEELQFLVMAIEDGADDVKSQSQATGFPVPRVYELRKKLKAVVPTVLAEFNKGTVQST
ncbi:MAG: hypothetical protein HZA88_04790 [Verrucomicrobia bacterium]|nr:hypothetical protein [Verrucomicrobiota bacterium]